jgi:anti-anti-sigma regulatory factor
MVACIQEGQRFEDMLRITLHDSPEILRFQLEGKLVGPWVSELEQSWKTARSVQADKKLVVDLRDVTFIDDSGKDLLRRFCESGAEFVACEPLTCAIVEQVTHCRASQSARQKRARRWMSFRSENSSHRSA